MTPNPAAIARMALAEQALQKEPELREMLEILAARLPSTVVEIGTYTGSTFLAWCQVAAPDALLVTMDERFRRSEYLARSSFRERLRARLLGYDAERILGRYAQPRQSVGVIHGDSQSAEAKEALRRRLGDRTIDFLFIDGDHSYEGVRRDFENYRDLLADDAIVAFHDIVEHRPEANCRVYDAWEEIKQGYRYRELIHEPESDAGWGPWGGIGVLFLDG